MKATMHNRSKKRNLFVWCQLKRGNNFGGGGRGRGKKKKKQREKERKKKKRKRERNKGKDSFFSKVTLYIHLLVRLIGY
jgi:hypothetical protein